MVIELTALIKTEDLSHQNTDIDGSNPFYLEFGPALKHRHIVQVLGFQGVLSSVTMPSQNPSTKSHLGLTPLGLFLLLQEQVYSSQSEIPKLQHHHHFYSLGIMNNIPFHLNQSSS